MKAKRFLKLCSKQVKMTLSILIPIYNFDVNNLVDDLHKQCEELGIDFEIVLVDDFSDEAYHNKNKKLGKLSNVTYERLKQNIGRSKIRNKLLKKARFENCLILDCDVAVESTDFIKKYIDAIDGNSVIVGGHIYQTNPPNDTSKMLHWKYGTQVECKPVKERLKNPYDSFLTNSFLVPKKVFNRVKFDEILDDYGHEDTLFGIVLEMNKIEIKHIDNPVIHLGLKTAKDFLAGEKSAIKNLVFLTNHQKYKYKITQKSKLLRHQNSFLLNSYFKLLSLLNNGNIYEKLNGKNPNLRLLNVWKYKTLKEFKKLN